MKQRIITGIIGGALIALVTYLGGFVFNLIYALIAIIGVYELAKMFDSKIIFSYETVSNCFLILFLYLVNIFTKFEHFTVILFVYVAINFVIYLLNKKITIQRLSNAMLIGLYVVLFMYYMVRLNDTPYVWLVYIIAFGTDTFAYFTGVFLGKHKLCPSISPKKTIEGAIGGVVGSTVLGLIFFLCMGVKDIWAIIIFNVLASIFSMFGDLFASRIKREKGIKDFGNLLPGHGGILDRFDSILFVAPIVYYFVTYII